MVEVLVIVGSGFDSGCNFYDRDIVASEVDMVTVKLLLVL